MLEPRPTPKLEDHPSSAVRGCLFNLYTPTLHGVKFIQNFCRKTWKKEASRNVGYDLMELIDLAEYRDHWLAHSSEHSGTIKDGVFLD